MLSRLKAWARAWAVAFVIRQLCKAGEQAIRGVEWGKLGREANLDLDRLAGPKNADPVQRALAEGVRAFAEEFEGKADLT